MNTELIFHMANMWNCAKRDRTNIVTVICFIQPCISLNLAWVEIVADLLSISKTVNFEHILYEVDLRSFQVEDSFLSTTTIFLSRTSNKTSKVYEYVLLEY